MLKKTVQYTNFNDQQVTEEHFFHLSKAELVEMELSMEGGLSKHLTDLVEKGDGRTIMETFKKLLLDAYGIKSEDGRRFIKNQEVRDEFASSEAYSQIFMELATSADAAAEFINGIVPQGMDEEVEKFRRDQDKPDLSKPPEAPPGQKPKAVPDPEPAPQELGVKAATQRILTRAELEEMPAEELQRLLASGEARLASTEG